jgi:hypothetical protein
MRLPLPLMDPLNVVLVPLPPAVSVKLPRLIPPLPAIEPMALLIVKLPEPICWTITSLPPEPSWPVP